MSDELPIPLFGLEEGAGGEKKRIFLHHLLPYGGWLVSYGVVNSKPRILIVTRGGQSLIVVGGWNMEAFRFLNLEFEKSFGGSIVLADPEISDFIKGPGGLPLPTETVEIISAALREAAAKEAGDEDVRGFVSLCWSGGMPLCGGSGFGPVPHVAAVASDAEGYVSCPLGSSNEPRCPLSLRAFCRSFVRDARLAGKASAPKLRMLPNMVSIRRGFSESTHYSSGSHCLCQEIDVFAVLQELGEDGDGLSSAVEVALLA